MPHKLFVNLLMLICNNLLPISIFIGGQLVHDIRGLKNKNHRTDHIIHHLSFGDEFPGQINPLDNSEVSIFVERLLIFEGDRLNGCILIYLARK